MKKTTVKSMPLAWLLLGFLLIFANMVHAEGGCPPGMIPASGTDINSCVPIPPGYYGNQQQTQPQPPPPQWVDHWGAIATALPMGILGVANNLSSQNQAEQAALADCQSKGGSTCKIDLSYRNQCAAMIVGHPGYNVTPGVTQNAAMQTGLKTCTDAGDTNCHVYYSACSLPVRIQ